MQVNIVNHSKHALPSYQTENSAGMDLRADIDSAITLKPLQRVLVPTNLFMELPSGFEAQIRPRSGLAFKNGITVLNSPGTIDADYRGELKILLINLSDQDFVIQDGERIAQMVISKHDKIDWVEVKELANTQRAAGGFGSTGVR